MTDDERAVITELEKCDFTQLAAHYKDMLERRRNTPFGERQVRKGNEYCKILFGLMDKAVM